MGIIFSFFVLGLYSILSVLGLFCLIKPNYLYFKGKSYSRLAILGFNIVLFVVAMLFFTLTAGLSPTSQSELDKVSGWGTLAMLLGLVFAIVCWVKVHQNYKSNVTVSVITKQDPISSPVEQNTFMTYWCNFIADLKMSWQKAKQEVEEKERLKKAKKEQAEQEKRVAQEIETLRGFGQSKQSDQVKKWSDEEWDNLTAKTRSQASSLGSKNYDRSIYSSTKYDDDYDEDDDFYDDNNYDSFYDDDDDLSRYDDLVPEFDISYKKESGEISHREIAVIYVNERYVVAYCFQACEKRTFRLDRFISVMELSSGQSYFTSREIKKVCSLYIKDDL